MTIQRSWPKSSDGPSGWYMTDTVNGWSQFMKDYAVYPSNTGCAIGTHSATWRIRSQYGASKTIGLAVGTYTLECQSDNASTFTWQTTPQNQTNLGTLSATASHNTSTNFTINITDADIEQYLVVDITNNSAPPNTWSNNPAGVAWELKNSGGTVIRRSTDSFDSQLKFSEIAAEFGYPSANKFGNYRNTTTISGSDLGALPLDTGMPTSGVIRFSDFFEKQLNVVVDCYDSCPNYHVNARSEWNNNNVVVVGDTNGSKRNDFSKIIIHANKEIGSQSSTVYAADAAGKETERGKCALRTGTGWSLTSKMVIDIGDSAKLRGAGGKGGKGNNPANDAGNVKHGREGTSALGIQFGSSHNKTVINVNSSAIIRAGYGGGGGGGGSYFDEGKGASGYAIPGCGGGGGAGWPVGAAGAAGGGNFSDGHTNQGAANPGSAGTKTAGGDGGTGQSVNKEGGDGGDDQANAQNGITGECDAGCSVNGVGGGNGTALRSTGASNTYTLNNNGSMVGGTKNSGDVS